VNILPNGFRTLYGDCDYDVRHSLNGSYVYQLPLHSSRGWLETIVGGWQLSGTLFVRGGFPTYIWSDLIFSVPNGPGIAYANVIPGQSLYQKAPIAGITQPGTIQWLNPFAFQSVWDPIASTCYPTNSPQNCGAGDSGRSLLRSPGFTWTDLAISKSFKITERVKFKFDAQFYNLFNHPNFASPNFSFAGIQSEPGTLTGFGAISQTAGPNTGLLGGQLGGDSSVRMIALRGTIQF
jgi:hypothetical protein